MEGAPAASKIHILLSRGVASAALLSSALGATVFAGWQLQVAGLVQIFASSAAVQANAAVAFILVGAALFSLSRGAERTAAVLGIAVSAVGLHGLAESLIAYEWQVNPYLIGAANPLRSWAASMAPVSALSFTIAGIALACASAGGRFPLGPPLIAALASILVGIGAVASAGYFTGLSGAYAWGKLGDMALATATSLMVIGGGILALGWRAGRQQGRSPARWLPLLVGAGGAAATLMLSQALYFSERSKIAQVIRHEALHVHDQMISSIKGPLNDALRMASRWQRLRLEISDAAQIEAALQIEMTRGLRALGWIATTHRFRWVVSSEDYRRLMDLDLSLDPRHKSALEIARSEGMSLARGGAAFADDVYLFFAPVGREDGPEEYLAGVLHAREILREIVENETYAGYSIAVYDGDREIYRRKESEPRHEHWLQASSASFGAIGWTVRVWPKPATLKALQSPADGLALVIGIFSTLLIAAVTHLAQTAQRRAAALQAANLDLERAMAERRRAEEGLRDSEAQYRELFDKARDSISLISSDGKFIAVNPGFEAMAGFSAKDWIGRPFADIIHPDDLPQILGYFQKLLEAETIPIVEFRFLTARGVYRFGEVSASTRYRHGQVAGAMAIVRDITERKLAQQQLELQLQRISAQREINLAATSTLDLDALLNRLMETIRQLLPYGAILVWLRNSETGELERAACSNLNERDWMGRKLAGVPELVRAAVSGKAPVVVADIQNDPRTLDRDFYRRNGLISYLGVPLTSNEECLGVLVFLTRQPHAFGADEVAFLNAIASQAAVAIQNAQLYKETRRQGAELERANKAQADFTAMIAHDLRSPLSNIIGIAEMMHQGLFGEPNQDQKEWLNRMANNGKGLVNLVSDFLDVSKLESGHIELARVATDIVELVRNTVANYLPVAASKQILLAYRGEDSLPPIAVDSRRLDQVLTNLLSNALKFAPPGGSIEIAAVRERGRMRVSVNDTGRGIPGDQIADLFQKYRQLSRSMPSESAGTGLGLVICKMIVEAHGGEIGIESQEGRGTSVSFTLPLDTPEPGARGDAPSFQTAGSEA